MNQNSIENIIASISKLISLTNREKEILRANLSVKKIKVDEVIHSVLQPPILPDNKCK